MRRTPHAVAALIVLSLLAAPSLGHAQPSCGQLANPIPCENALPGNPASEWDVAGSGSATIQGFATDISVNRGETVRFKILTPSTNYRLDIYRMGWYGGLGARRVATVQPSAALPQSQPGCLTQAATGLVDCGNWAESASWPVPADAVSGIYFARLVREDGPAGASHAVFIVRDDASDADLLFQTSDTTWQAYNSYGGNSLYVGNPDGRAYKVSYNRPFNTRAGSPEDWLFNAEYPMVRWLERNGYNVAYFTGVDSDRRGAQIRNHRVFLSVGHDEYWSAAQRTAVEAARDAGVHLAFFSGNEVFWKTRWESSIDASGTAHRTLVCYKETHNDAKIDPLPGVWTGTWRDPRFSPPADGGRPENALTGTLFMVNDGATTSIVVPEADGKMRFWRNTTVATLAPGASATLPNGTLGYEWDADVDNGRRPAGLVPLSRTTVNGPVLQDFGSTFGPGVATHRLSLYRAPSGARVFGAGTIQWSWGLDNNHDRGSAAPDPRMQQATVNLLADMGAQPATLQSGLVAATASTDATPPTSAITSPAAGATVPVGSAVTITGTAADTGGGRVGAVEVSVDGGATWRPANGRESWSFTWTPTTAGTATIRSSAVDDSGNIQTATTAVTVTVGGGGGGGPATCPCTLFPATATPATPNDADPAAVEIGVKFRSDVNGSVTAIRFYKGPLNTGTHVGHLWTATGTLLGTATFSGESASGWQQATFPTPIAITANTVYVASYFAPVGRYAVDDGFFTVALDRPPLHAPATATTPNGVYRYGPSGFPDQTFAASNYWVDVVFTTTGGGGGADTTPPTVTATSPAAGATGVAVTANVTATFSEAMDPASITTATFELRDAANALVPAAVTWSTGTLTATLDPTASLAAGATYTATVRGGATDPRARDLAGNPLASSATWSFTTATAGGGGGGAACPCTIFPAATTPATPSSSDTAAVEVGVKFRSDVDGTVTALRFYKGAQNTGTHVGHLWTLTGTLLGTVTFSGETASGWQQATFPTPIPITANTTYVASYFAPVGRYAFTSGFFTAPTDRPPLHAPATSTTPNGVYRYGPSAFPTETFNAANYWVDVVFTTTGGGGGDTTPPTVTASSPATGATGVAVTANVTATFSEAMDPASISTSTFELRNPAGTLVAAAVTWSAGTLTATLDPTASLAAGATYTATVRGGATEPRARDVAGNALAANATWSFTTAAGGDTTPPTVTATSPTAGATGVAVTANVTATFNEAMDPASISTATIELRNAAGALVAAAVTWDAGTRTATLDPSASLDAGASYTATVRGGATDPRVRDVAGNPLATSVTWSFTTAGGTGGGGPCPCTLFLPSATPATASANDGAAVEVGVKFTSDVAGSVTAIRFYKGSLNTGTHVGHLWTATGTLLGTATFSGETGSGWQQASFPTPIAITANTTYVASYFAPVGRYAFNSGFFTTPTDRPPLHAPATSVTPNGVYRYGPSGFPNQTFNAANYWVDVVFNTTGGGGPDTTPPTVTGTTPSDGATGVSTAANVTATFSEAMDGTTITTSTFELRDGASALVPAAVSYDTATRVATLNPAATLAPATSYTATVRGGTTDPRVRDLAGNALATSVTWTFTTASGPAPAGTGLILVVTPSSGGFGRYLPEILQAEGLNAFNTTTLPQVTPGVLAAHDVVVLAETPLSPAEVTMFTDWVNGGGNLIAMRPDPALAGLLGLTSASGTLTNAYLAINTGGPPGAGLVSQTIQFHGAADRYTLNGATAVATLFSSATASTSNPAVTLREVGSLGGNAAAFTYDLARSIVYTRQGNPAWIGQERDGFAPIRSDDLYFGAAAGDPQPDWVNLAKAPIPQADEQQRLLANLILHVNRDRTPLPRFWYFPRGLRAVVVMTGDDHANGGTIGRFDAQLAASPPGCSVDEWQCIRSTSYVYPDTPITDAQAAAYAAQGFEISIHINTGCADYTPTSLAAIYDDQLTTWATAFPSLQPPATHRMHCIAWSDWVTQARVDLNHEIGLDTSYYYWPPEWVANRPGFFTASGMPMRFADVDGSVIDVYQATTQMTDESSQTYPFTAEALLDGALGANGYFGFFVANMHTDAPDSTGSDGIIAAARARNVPIITARQLLAWLDGRNGSTFSDLSFTGGVLRFTVGVGAGANGLQGMLPVTSTAGTLNALTRNGASVSFTVQTIKGVSYAVFTAAPGTWEARYQ